MRPPGIEPGSDTWKVPMRATTPRTLLSDSLGTKSINALYISDLTSITSPGMRCAHCSNNALS